MKLRIQHKHMTHMMWRSMEALIERARHAHLTSVTVRINGHDEHFEADWIKHLVIEEQD